MSEETKDKHTTTVYDDVFRTLITDCPSLIIPVLNEVFHHNIDRNAKIQLIQNEVFITSPDKTQKRITDSNLLINALRYHVECQTNPDKTMFIRIWEYDSQIALQDFELHNHTLTVTFPHTTVLYLRHYSTTPDIMKICIQVPGDVCSYEIPVIKLQHYTIDQIFEKELYLFIPYHIFCYEKDFAEYDDNEHYLDELKKIYETILERLEASARSGQVNEYAKHLLIDMTTHIINYISKNHQRVQKGLGDIMGGKVLDYPTKTLFNQAKEAGHAEGLAEGRAEGRAEGELTKLLSLVQVKLEKGKSIEQIADETEETIETVQALIKEHNLSA